MTSYRTLTVFCSVVCSASAASIPCSSPKYRNGATFINDTATVVRSISISLQEFSPSRLVCLASTLRERYQDRDDIMIYIFSSDEASRGPISVPEVTKEDIKAFAQLHALYVLDADKRQEYVRIMPVGIGTLRALPTDGPYSTRIDLPVTNTPHCQLELKSRCLIALEDLHYPAGPLSRSASGKVTLRATITRAGLLKQVRVVKSESAPRGLESVLAKAAAQNLSQWRLEPGARDEPVQIKYSYEVDRSLRYEDGPQVRWSLPNEIAISHGPPK